MPDKRHRRIIRSAAHKYGIRPETLYGVWGVESNFATHGNSVSSAGAQGPFQFMPATAQSYGINPHKFKQSAFAAAKYLGSSKRAGKGFGRMLSDYNAGPAGAYQPDYVAAVRAKAGGWKDPGGRDSTGQRSAGGGGGPQTIKQRELYLADQFDQKGYEQAQRKALLAQFLQKSPGWQDSSLFRTGALSTEAPDPNEYMQETLKARMVKHKIPGKGARGGGRGPGGAAVHGGGGWGGTKNVAYYATEGLPRGSQKRSPSYNESIGGSPTSDHLTTHRSTYAVDVPAAGTTGDRYARRIARRLGLKGWHPGTYASFPFKAAGGRTYRVQLLWKVDGHYDHVHVGISA